MKALLLILLLSLCVIKASGTAMRPTEYEKRDVKKDYEDIESLAILPSDQSPETRSSTKEVSGEEESQSGEESEETSEMEETDKENDNRNDIDDIYEHDNGSSDEDHF